MYGSVYGRGGRGRGTDDKVGGGGGLVESLWRVAGGLVVGC